MKRLLTIILSTLLLATCLTACGGNQTPTTEPEHTLTFKEGRLVTINDTEYVGIFFDYTNNSGETALPCEAINVKAFQNGTELNVVVYTGNKIDGAIQCDASVQTGMTAEVIWAFEPQDHSTVSVECTDGQKFEFELDDIPWQKD